MAGDGAFGLDLELTERERSLDSHENTLEVHLEGGDVQYHGPYGEGIRGRFETRSVAFELDDDQRRAVRRTLDNPEFRRSIEETHWPDTGRMPTREVEIEGTVLLDGESYGIHVEGVTRVKGKPTDMEYLEQATGLLTLCRRFQGWAEAANDRAWWTPLGWTPFGP
ncbi:hypothetical protein BRD00_14640 [Halobacteriales archaeon QS_8_69_26]|nr:MAG: hypothetical protein BRD00_14640 [Halobacteriales archaeon QS_8_69_26]